MKKYSELSMIDIDVLKHKIISNCDKYLGDIRYEARNNIEVAVKKSGAITSYSKHFDCFVKIKHKNLEEKEKYIFAKYSEVAEFNNLLKVKNLYEKEALKPKVPKPLDYFSDRKILIMEGIKGENFLLYFLKRLLPGVFLFNKNDVKCKILLCASWLAEFHNLAYVGESKNLNNEIELALMRLKHIPEFNASNNVLEKFLQASKGKIGSTPISLTHRDFSARNIILINKDDIIVVDWAQIIKKNIYYSIAYFITNLESRKRDFIYSFVPIKTLESLFLEEYKKKSKLDFDISTYNIVKKLYYIEYLYEYYTGTGVFEKWTKTNRKMEYFIGTIVRTLLDGL